MKITVSLIFKDKAPLHQGQANSTNKILLTFVNQFPNKLCLNAYIKHRCTGIWFLCQGCRFLGLVGHCDTHAPNLSQVGN